MFNVEFCVENRAGDRGILLPAESCSLDDRLRPNLQYRKLGRPYNIVWDASVQVIGRIVQTSLTWIWCTAW